MYEKNRRYRQKCIREKRCPHCGKPSPWYGECDERRSKKRIYHTISKGVRVGLIVRLPDGRVKLGNPNASWGPRGSYRVNPAGQAPRGLKKFLRANLDNPDMKEILEAIESAEKAWKDSLA